MPVKKKKVFDHNELILKILPFRPRTFRDTIKSAQEIEKVEAGSY